MQQFAINAFGNWEHLSTVLGMPISARSVETLTRRLFGNDAIVTHHMRHNPTVEWWQVSIGGEFVADIFLDEPMTPPTYSDVWAGNADTDKFWSK